MNHELVENRQIHSTIRSYQDKPDLSVEHLVAVDNGLIVTRIVKLAHETSRVGKGKEEGILEGNLLVYLDHSGLQFDVVPSIRRPTGAASHK